jgi:hypothetical protein
MTRVLIYMHFGPEQQTVRFTDWTCRFQSSIKSVLDSYRRQGWTIDYYTRVD